jgi:phage shock protein PspC (stress-responsive transcriptional regulator)
MKPTTKVSIGNWAFNLEEDAYSLLKNYLDKINTHYETLSSGKEIIEDIELRIAELLRERISAPEQPISENIIKEVIDILGFPEEIENNEKQPEKEFSENKKTAKQKKLYRDTENKVVGGVCSGLAAYFNIDVVLIRVAFVFLFFVLSAIQSVHFPPIIRVSIMPALLIYIILWIAMPRARTVQQRHEMRGEKTNLKNIQEKVEREFREAKEGIKKHRSGLGKVVHGIAKVCLIFAGALAILITVCVLIALVLAFGFSFTAVHTILADLIDFVDISWNPGWFFCLITLLVFLPLIGILYSGIKLLFRIKTKVRVGLIILLLWIASLFTLISMSVYHAKDYLHWRTVHEYIELPFNQYDTLYVDIPQAYYQEGTLEAIIDRVDDWKIGHKNIHHKQKKHRSKKQIINIEVNNYEIVTDNSSLFFYKKDKNAEEALLLFPAIDSRTSKEEPNLGIDIYKDAAGKNRRNAYYHAQEIAFNYTLQDSLLILEPLVYTKERKWNGELIRLHFNVPEGKTVVFGKAFR